ncbi:hypothetical protein Tco_1267371, partial [Tanacetum coccineum]
MLSYLSHPSSGNMSQRFRKAYAGIRQERTSTPETVIANNELNQFMKQ